MGIKSAIEHRNTKELKGAVEKALDLYKIKLPIEPLIETVYGQVPVSLIFDEDTKWEIATQEYVKIANIVSSLPTNLDVTIETAKLIGLSGILRHLVEPTKTSNGLL